MKLFPFALLTLLFLSCGPEYELAPKCDLYPELCTKPTVEITSGNTFSLLSRKASFKLDRPLTPGIETIEVFFVNPKESFTQKISELKLISSNPNEPTSRITGFELEVPKDVLASSKLDPNQNAAFHVRLYAYDGDEKTKINYFFEVLTTF